MTQSKRVTKIDDELTKDLMKYCMTEIPKDLYGFPLIDTNEIYDKDFWDKVADSIRKENEEYEKLCRNMQIDPISGKSTMSWEDRNKMFTI